MSHIMLIIPGKPIAKARPRFARRGNFVKTYSAQETEEGRFLWEVRQQYVGEPMEGPLTLKATFFMPIPKGTAKKKLAAMLALEEKHIKKPDADNLLKFVKDCLNQVCWRDDAQVWKVYAEKRYSEQPRTVIEIMQ